MKALSDFDKAIGNENQTMLQPNNKPGNLLNEWAKV